MLDDTCYFIGFEGLEFAVYTFILLNSPQTKEFLQSITFTDAKRMFTKDILMRIDLFTLAAITPATTIQQQLEFLQTKYNLHVTFDRWDAFLQLLAPKQKRQLSMF